MSLGLFQRATGRELWHLVLPGQRNDKATRDALVDLDAAGRGREELRLPDNRKLWCLTAAGRREAAGLLPAGAKLSALRPAHAAVRLQPPLPRHRVAALPGDRPGRAPPRVDLLQRGPPLWIERPGLALRHLGCGSLHDLGL
ncbi:hypothetical protein [Kitasatospora sp. NPDC058190]|uniref:hypothetical protein n=1 Tax=Kitasatospora sp. NPDC058190 TaxID=3346371 RepID=UPI0036DD3C6F